MALLSIVRIRLSSVFGRAIRQIYAQVRLGPLVLCLVSDSFKFLLQVRQSSYDLLFWFRVASEFGHTASHAQIFSSRLLELYSGSASHRQPDSMGMGRILLLRTIWPSIRFTNGLKNLARNLPARLSPEETGTRPLPA